MLVRFDALLLAARKLSWMMACAIGKAHLIQSGQTPLVALFGRDMAVQQRQLNILQSGGARQQIEILKDEPDTSIANGSECIGESSDTFSPASQYSPVDGVSRQPRRFMNVDLPEPDGPITATNSPACTFIDTVLSAAIRMAFQSIDLAQLMCHDDGIHGLEAKPQPTFLLLCRLESGAVWRDADDHVNALLESARHELGVGADR